MFISFRWICTAFFRFLCSIFPAKLPAKASQYGFCDCTFSCDAKLRLSVAAFIYLCKIVRACDPAHPRPNQLSTFRRCAAKISLWVSVCVALSFNEPQTECKLYYALCFVFSHNFTARVECFSSSRKSLWKHSSFQTLFYSSKSKGMFSFRYVVHGRRRYDGITMETNGPRVLRVERAPAQFLSILILLCFLPPLPLYNSIWMKRKKN